MSRRIRPYSLIFIAVGSLMAACDSNAAPEESIPFDSGTALLDHAALETALSSDALASLRGLSGRIPIGVSPSPSAVARAPIISELHRGVTFVYDPAGDEYVVDPDRGGAPPTGVRFVLYELDAAGRPLVEDEIGHADLVDEGDGSTEDVVLHLTVVDDGQTVLDYRTALDDTGMGGTLSVGGFLTERNVRLDFNIDAAGMEDGARSNADLSFDLRIDARDFRVTGTVRGSEEGPMEEGEIDLTARHGHESIRVDVRGEDGIIDGSVRLNDDLFATVSGPADDPTFLGSSGDPLTGAEFLVLWHVVDSVEDVFDLLEDLVDPVDELVFLGAVL